MKNKYYILIMLTATFALHGCSGRLSSKLKNEQYSLITDNVKKICGSDYEAVNFKVSEQGFTNQEKTSYLVKFTFDLNRPYLVFQGKNIPGELRFRKNQKEGWECTFNSGNAMGLFNLLKVN